MMISFIRTSTSTRKSTALKLLLKELLLYHGMMRHSKWFQKPVSSSFSECQSVYPGVWWIDQLLQSIWYARRLIYPAYF